MYGLPYSKSVCGGPNLRQTADCHGYRYKDCAADELQDGRRALEDRYACTFDLIGSCEFCSFRHVFYRIGVALCLIHGVLVKAEAGDDSRH